MKVRAAFAALLFSTGAVAQDDCPQGRAIYTDADDGWQLTFTEPEQGLGISTNYFTLSPKGSDLELQAWVRWDDEPEAPFADVLLNCPDGDVTGAEMDACRVWRGPVYELSEEGGADWLPQGDEPAVPALLLPLLAQAIKRSDVGAEVKALPWDAWSLTGCSRQN